MNSQQPKLGAAFRDGQLVMIEDVESGLACGCVCPACGTQLVARKGQVRLHHFAHHNAKPCEYGAEMIAVCLADWILRETMKFNVPPIYSMPKCILSPLKTLELEELVIGNPFESPIPDLLLRDKEGNRLIVQVRINHEAEQGKILRIGEEGCSAVEVRVPRCELLSAEEIRKVVVGNVGSKYWLFNREAAIERYLHHNAPDGLGRGYKFDEDYYGYFPGDLTCGNAPFPWLASATGGDS